MFSMKQLIKTKLKNNSSVFVAIVLYAVWIETIAMLSALGVGGSTFLFAVIANLLALLVVTCAYAAISRNMDNTGQDK